jgi:hypothetical protein
MGHQEGRFVVLFSLRDKGLPFRFATAILGLLMRIGIRGTTPHRLRRSKEGSAMTRTTIQKISEDHNMLLNT